MALVDDLYKRSLDQAIGLTAIIVMVLLDDKSHQIQKKALIDYVKALPPQKNWVELSSTVHDALCKLGTSWKEIETRGRWKVNLVLRT
jgi:hypothetical protein